MAKKSKPMAAAPELKRKPVKRLKKSKTLASRDERSSTEPSKIHVEKAGYKAKKRSKSQGDRPVRRTSVAQNSDSSPPELIEPPYSADHFNDIRDGNAICDIRHYSVRMHGGSVNINSQSKLWNHEPNGPSIRISITGIEYRRGDPKLYGQGKLSSLIFLFQDNISGKIETRYDENQYYTYAGMSELQFYPMIQLLNRFQDIKCYVSYSAIRGKFSVSSAFLNISNKQIGGEIITD